MLMVGLVLVQLQILHVNPLLGMLGFHFYQVELKNSDTALVITRSRDLAAGCQSGATAGPRPVVVDLTSASQQMNFYVLIGHGGKASVLGVTLDKAAQDDLTSLFKRLAGFHRRGRRCGIRSWISRR